MHLALTFGPQLVETTRALDLTGVFANALLGATIADSKRLDVFGLFALGIISGLGGGILRDVLLQQGTPVAFTDYVYLLVAASGAAVAFLIRLEGRLWDSSYRVIDAFALGCWAVAGAQRTLDAGLGWLPAVLLGAVTAVGGGATRDVLLGSIPSIFTDTELYATAALAASGTATLLAHLGHPAYGTAGGILVGAGLRLTATRFGWYAPRGRGWSVHRRRRADGTDGQDGTEGTDGSADST